jgi:hypothetical protein
VLPNLTVKKEMWRLLISIIFSYKMVATNVTLCWFIISDNRLDKFLTTWMWNEELLLAPMQ